jgi:predicted dehydrogenase
MEAYRDIPNMELVAVCDRDETRLQEKGRQFGVPHLYADLGQMLATEKPDVLHIVTPPTIREEPMALAGEAGVRGILVEKPVALSLPQAQAIAEVAEHYGLKVAVNTQRRYHPAVTKLKQVLDEKRLGDLLFVRCATRGNLLSMGPHLLDTLQFFLDDISPVSVWACAHGINGRDYGHPAPAKTLARLVYPQGITVYFEDADDAVCTPGEAEFWHHLRLDFWGATGRAWYAQSHEWGYQVEGMATAETEPALWDAEEEQGQRLFTIGMADWLTDSSQPHLNRLDHSLTQFNIIMAMMLSIHLRQPVPFPADVPDDIVEIVEKEIQQ